MANGSGTYRTLFDLYVSGYRATSTSLRSKTENETIDAALSTFGGLTDKTDQEITRLAASQDPGDAFAAEDMTTILEAGLSNIKDIFTKAIEWDAAHVKAASVTSQPNVAKVADAQEATDQELVANLSGLISKASEALDRAAGSEPPPEPQPDTGPEDEVETDSSTDSSLTPSDEPDEVTVEEVEAQILQEDTGLTEEMVIEDDNLSGISAPEEPTQDADSSSS